MGMLFTRKRPDYTDNEAVWKKCYGAYSGGETYIADALIKHTAEHELEFDERQRRAHYFNYPRAIAQRITSFALAVEPARPNANTEILEDMTLLGNRANDLMRQISTLLSVFGRVWVLVDVPGVEEGMNLDTETARKNRIRPYARVLSPLSVKDWAYGADGMLLWALVEEEHCYDKDPFVKRVAVKRLRLWTRSDWRLYEKESGEDRVIQSGGNPTGMVPLVEVTEPDGYGLDCKHWFEDVVRISNSIMNNESEAQMNVVKQMFGMLVVHEDFMSQTSKASKGDAGGFAAAVARSSAIFESDSGKGITRYISPSGVETATIRSENEKLKIELYETVGLAMQSRSREAQSSESKSWDFQNVSQFLANRADILEHAEMKIWELIHLWDHSIAVPEVTYNRKFAIRDVQQSISALLQLYSMPDSGIEMQKQMARTKLELMNELVEVGSDTYKKITTESESMQPAPVPDFHLGDFGGNGENEKELTTGS